MTNQSKNYNFIEKERRKLFREFLHQYIEEGYSQKEAKKLAARDADELAELDREFVDHILEAEFEDRNS